jgi:hypothetical protein
MFPGRSTAVAGRAWYFCTPLHTVETIGFSAGRFFFSYFLFFCTFALSHHNKIGDYTPKVLPLSGV